MATLEIRWPDDETLEVVVDGNVVASANHDEHGWDGMNAVASAATSVGRALGATVDVS